jgi:hypothetical protein
MNSYEQATQKLAALGYAHADVIDMLGIEGHWGEGDYDSVVKHHEGQLSLVHDARRSIHALTLGYVESSEPASHLLSQRGFPSTYSGR